MVLYCPVAPFPTVAPPPPPTVARSCVAKLLRPPAMVESAPDALLSIAVALEILGGEIVEIRPLRGAR